MYPRCIHGHLLTDDNFLISEMKDGTTRKRCRKCVNISSKKWRKKNREHMRKYLRAYRERKRKK